MPINLRVRVGVEWVNDFPSGTCQQADLSYCDDQLVGFYNMMGIFGHTKVFNWGNNMAWETDFRDPAFGGNSFSWSDNVHFCCFGNHGGNSNNNFRITFAVQHANCSVSTAQMRLGRKSMKWFAAYTCQAVLNTSASHILAVWAAPMRGVHIVCGFIGNSADSWWTRNLGADFAWDICRGGAIAGCWVDRAYSFWTGDDSIAIAAGATQAEAVSRRNSETLNWRDMPVASTIWLAWKYRT